ncbi:MAG: NADH:ubiquinone reductase (Na(+)-transporting) subunit F, partial [Bacteroidales bacterium]|nr:NADH:ubiquinone reductase (Na(+)-transporting) subunit F [Bacteroidales bacterium]
MTNTVIFTAMAIMVIVILILVAVLLLIKGWLTPKGKVKISINGGKKVVEVTPGGSLLSTLAEEKIYLPSACGGKGNCGQCKCRVVEGGGNILPTEVGFFNRKQIQDNWRLGCQVKVKEDLGIVIPDSALSVKKLECEVISNLNVATFIKEFTVKLPEGEHIDFKSGEYIQIDIPACTINFSDMDIDPEYRAEWERYGFFDLKMVNPEATIRAYSMASYPGEKNIIKLNVRIATPPFDR